MVEAWRKDPKSPQVFLFFGVAGTGKTTLIKHFAEGVDGKVAYVTPTGKSAHVLQTKGCPDAGTIHSQIYISRERSRQRLLELEQELLRTDPSQVEKIDDLRRRLALEKKRVSQPNFLLDVASEIRKAKLIVLDEGSMVDERVGTDLMSFGVKILVIGDPFQLPPVYGAGFFTSGRKADVTLTEPHRHAKDNPIYRIATEIRENRRLLPIGEYGGSRIVSAVDPQEATTYDQILVGRNATRRGTNKRMRSLLGRTNNFPEAGDKLVCLRNDYEKGLLNGEIWRATSDALPMDEQFVVLSVENEEGGAPQEVLAHAHYFLGKSEDLPYWDRTEASEFDYGYVLTVHKSQGSQWNNVLLINEGECFRENVWRWLYTGVTRAAENVTVVCK